MPFIPGREAARNPSVYPHHFYILGGCKTLRWDRVSYNLNSA